MRSSTRTRRLPRKLVGERAEASAASTKKRRRKQKEKEVGANLFGEVTHNDVKSLI